MEWKMETVYLACAAAGGTEIGSASSGEAHASDTGFGLFSVRTVSAFMTLFGLTGWAGIRAGWSTTLTLFAALTAGLIMLFAVAWLFHAQKRLASSGTVNPANAVGKTGRCYLRIPALNGGKGKITVAVQGRTIELSAFTNGREIATGAEVRVVRQVTPDTFEVESV
jgi:hypothetical protein